jgi:4-diphosphocytidyl-2-C-methyl-D-erythritol kinase
MTVATAAPAKLNLFLHVPGQRDDGYHRVDSLIAFAELGDRVSVASAADGCLTLDADGPFAAALPSAADNLVLHAADRLRRDVGMAQAGAAIRLIKALPVASGIGGGSADAAAVLRALAQLWQIEDAPARILDIARCLGADVPVCLAGRTALVTGIGDVFVATPDLPPAPLLLVNPGAAMPTADVFRALAAPPLPESAAPPDAGGWDGIADTAALATRLAGMRNDLETPAIALLPAIAETLTALRALPGCLLARMSGSGATCFALFDEPAAVERAATALRAKCPNWWVAASRLRSEAPAIDVV